MIDILADIKIANGPCSTDLLTKSFGKGEAHARIKDYTERARERERDGRTDRDEPACLDGRSDGNSQR